jgi:SAM-dependent methyltransferase
MQLQASPLADSYISKKDLDKKQKLFDMNLYLCEECGLVQLLTVVEPLDIYVDYLYKTTTSMGLAKHFVDSASNIINRYKLDKNSFVVDIGSNVGSLLSGYKNLGMQVLGIDPALEIAKEATANGIETLPIFFTQNTAKEIVKNYSKAKIINSNNMMANIDTINNLVVGIKELLADDGIFVMETSYLLHLIDNMVFDTIYHEHLSYFGLKPLEYLFKKNGLKVVDAEIVSTKGGSLKCYVEHDKGQEVSKNILEIRDIERKRKLYEESIYQDYILKISLEKKHMLDFLEKVKNERKTVCGYGASNTTTTLLHHFEIAEYFDYIVDDNDIKIGRFSPNYHIPILSSDVIYDKKPDYIVIFAWRFKDIIMKKHQSYLKSRGKFVVPLSNFEVISSQL